MIIICHRGNQAGPNFSKENHPDYLKDALKNGYHVEADVWYVAGQLVLGHDHPEYDTDKSFLSNKKIWIHAKNLEALHYLSSFGNLFHYFFHNTDDATLTSKGFIWTYPNKLVGNAKSIAVLPERNKIQPSNLYYSAGICTDYPQKYKR